MQRAREGNTDALGQLLEACRVYLRWEARRQIDPGYMPKGDASDMVQETFLDAFNDFTRFQGDTEEELLAWLRQLLRHNVSNFFRRYRGTAKRSVKMEVHLDSIGEPTRSGDSAIRNLLDGERNELLKQAIDGLPEEYQRILNLWTVEGKSFEEIARLSDCTSGNIRAKWFRAIQKLNTELSSMN